MNQAIYTLPHHHTRTLASLPRLCLLHLHAHRHAFSPHLHCTATLPALTARTSPHLHRNTLPYLRYRTHLLLTHLALSRYRLHWRYRGGHLSLYGGTYCRLRGAHGGTACQPSAWTY